MKRSTQISALGLTAALLIGCQKEEQFTQETEDQKPVAATEARFYQDFAAIPEADRSALFLAARDIVEGKSLQKSLHQSSEPTLAEAFLSLEGLTNNIFLEEWDHIENVHNVEFFVTLDYYEDDAVKRVSANEYSEAYSEIYNTILEEIDTINDDEFLMLDLTLEEIDEGSETATLGAKVYLANTVLMDDPVWYTPMSLVYAAEKAGWCDGTPNPSVNGFDAADYLQGYINATADWKSRCTNGAQFPVIMAGTMYTYYDGFSNQDFLTDPNTGTYTWNQVSNYYWKGSSNSCIGSTNEEWYGWYSKMDQLVSYGEVRAQNKAGYADAELWQAHYHSHSPAQPFPGYRSNPNISQTHYHGGEFHYAIVTCN